MDEQHLWAAIRYVEMNPVRAHLAAKPEEWEWSSAAAHLRGSDSRHVLDMGFWEEADGSRRWRELLGEDEREPELMALRQATYAGKPLGSKEFHGQIEEMRKRLRQDEEGVRGRSGGGLEAGDDEYFEGS
jgi:putative transposase